MNKKILFGLIALIFIAAVVAVLILVNPKSQEAQNSADTLIDVVNSEGPASFDSAGIIENVDGTDPAVDSEESGEAPVVIENEGDIEIIIPEDMGQDGF